MADSVISLPHTHTLRATPPLPAGERAQASHTSSLICKTGGQRRRQTLAKTRRSGAWAAIPESQGQAPQQRQALSPDPRPPASHQRPLLPARPAGLRPADPRRRQTPSLNKHRRTSLGPAALTSRALPSTRVPGRLCGPAPLGRARSDPRGSRSAAPASDSAASPQLLRNGARTPTRAARPKPEGPREARLPSAVPPGGRGGGGGWRFRGGRHVAADG